MTRLVHYAFYYDQKVTEGMVYTIKDEPKMMLMGWTILFLSLGLKALIVIINTQCELAKSSDLNKSNNVLPTVLHG